VAKDPSKTMPLMGHLGELRKRFIYSAIVVLVCVIAAFVLRKYVFQVLMRPLRDTQVHELTTLGVTEAFMQILKVSIYAGLTVSLPFLLYQFWAFVMPALYEREKRRVLPYTLATTALFLGGVVFAYFIVLPVGLKFLVGYGGEAFTQLLQAERYITFVSTFLLAFGAVFELPLIMLLLAWARIANYKQMRKVRRYAIVTEAVVAMILTPSQDPLSMALMLGPLMLLYEVGILLARSVARRRAKREQAEAEVVPEIESAGG
jgi:sec-independent protein translocase protein TatC